MPGDLKFTTDTGDSPVEDPFHISNHGNCVIIHSGKSKFYCKCVLYSHDGQLKCYVLRNVIYA